MNIKQLFVYVVKELPEYYYDGLSVGSRETIILRKGNFSMDIKVNEITNHFGILYNCKNSDNCTSVKSSSHTNKEALLKEIKNIINPILEKEIAALNKNDLIKTLAKDAQEYGNALNESAWAFFKSGMLF